MRNRSSSTRARFAAAMVAALCALACDDPPLDDPIWRGGNAPNPTGVIEGTVLYAGPRVQCARDGDGNATRVLGRVVLTLFDVRALPPPEGTGSSAASLYTIPGEVLFGAPSDEVCMPQSPDADDLMQIVQRSTTIQWPEIVLAAPNLATEDEETITYRVQGFYDIDEDFNPFFSVRLPPTRGDITGAALVDATAAVPEFAPIIFGDLENRPLGQVLSGVTVSLGAPVTTEPPAFTLSTDGLDSESDLPTDILTAPGILLALTNTSLNLLGRTELEPTDTSVGDCANVPNDVNTDDVDEHAECCRARYAGNAIGIAMCEGGVSYDVSDDRAYAWYIRTIDANRDGLPDPHPALSRVDAPGDGFVPWLAPLILMQRTAFDYVVGPDGNLATDDAGNPIPDATAGEREAEARIPAVVTIPSVDVRMWSPLGLGGTLENPSSPPPNDNLPTVVRYPDLPVLVSPVSAMITNPADARCQFPVFPPDTPTDLLEGAGTIDCQETPTGIYAITAIQGDALGSFISDTDFFPFGVSATQPYIGASDTGHVLVPNTFVSQSWTVPNEMGFPTQIEDPALSQSFLGSFTVYDSNPGNDRSLLSNRDTCLMAPDPTDGDNIRTVNYQNFEGFGDQREEVIANCCCGIAHLCGLPVCETIPSPANGQAINHSPRTVDENGNPDCIPFEMPAVCCNAVTGDAPEVACGG